MIKGDLPIDTLSQYMIIYERFSKYDKIHMNQRKEYMAFSNQLSIYELEMLGKNTQPFLEVKIGTNNCNATIMLTKKEIQGENSEIMSTLNGETA